MDKEPPENLKTDLELVVLSLQNSDNFGMIVKRYEKKLMAYIRHLVGANHPEAEDILQNSFIKMYEHLNGFDKSLKFSSWAYRITHNEAVDYARAKWRKQKITVELDENSWNNLTNDINLPQTVDNKIFQEKVINALGSLNEKYRTALTLYLLEEKNYEEISDILCKPIGTVGALISRGRKKLKEQLYPKK